MSGCDNIENVGEIEDTNMCQEAEEIEDQPLDLSMFDPLNMKKLIDDTLNQSDRQVMKKLISGCLSDSILVEIGLKELHEMRHVLGWSNKLLRLIKVRRQKLKKRRLLLHYNHSPNYN